MAYHYKWQLSMDANGPIWAGVIGGDTSMHSTSVLTGSAEGSYGYLDSNVVGHAVQPGANNTSEVFISIDTSWTVSFDNRNNMTVTTTTTIIGIARDNVVGNPAGTSNLARDMNAYHYDGGPSLWYYRDTNISQAKEIATDINLGSHSFTLAPGQEASQFSMYFFNKTVGAASAGDRINLGVKFINDMPADYRPGAILSSDSEWLSHNRTNGEAHILTSAGNWREMRTVAGLAESDNPPSIRTNDKWFNQREIGKE